MNAVFFAATVLALGMQGQGVEPSAVAKTQLYVKTVPAGAEITLDGKSLGKSDGLFDVTAGAHRLALRLNGYVPEERQIDARDGEITRVEAQLKKRSGKEQVLSYVGDTQTGMQSYADSGHAVHVQRPAGMKSLAAVRLFGARYGYEQPPKEDFYVYLLDKDRKVLEQFAVPYRQARKGDPSLVYHRRAAPRRARKVLRSRLVQRQSGRRASSWARRTPPRRRIPTPACPTRVTRRSISQSTQSVGPPTSG